MDYASWEKEVPEAIRGDTLWRVEAYRLALFAADLGWLDVVRLARDRRTLSLSDQLYRSLGSVSPNTAEGYSRSTGRDRARFYEYALGSAREARGWYYQGRHVLGHPVARHRMALLTQVIRLLLCMVPQQRGYVLADGRATYSVEPLGLNGEELGCQDLRSLLDDVPLPNEHAALES